MKKNLHPAYRTVVFQDVSAGKGFLTRSSISAKDTVTWEDGKTYPLVKVDVSAFSHPFYTGQQKVLDTAGRIDRFKKRFVASEGKTVDRKVAKTQPKRLAHVGSQKKEKTLSSAPKKDEKDAKKAAPKKDAKAAKKD